MTTTLLIHKDPFKPFVLEMDVFEFVIGVVFSQFGKDKIFILSISILISFFPPKINYKIHNKKTSSHHGCF